MSRSRGPKRFEGIPPASMHVAALGLLLLLLATRPAPLLGQPPQAPCASAEAGQFDFWVGDWEVRRPDGTTAGENTIRKILNGCVLHERYRTPGGYAGESFNIFDASRGRWHQTWVDAGGLLLVLDGSFKAAAMVLEGETVGPNGPVRQRITWNTVDGDENRVRQLWETSSDGGVTWTVAFDGLYLRKDPSPDLR